MCVLCWCKITFPTCDSSIKTFVPYLQSLTVILPALRGVKVEIMSVYS